MKITYTTEFKKFAKCQEEEPYSLYYDTFNGWPRVGDVTLYKVDWDNKITPLKTWKSFIREAKIDEATGLMTFRHLDYLEDDPGAFGTSRHYWGFTDEKAYITKDAALRAAHSSMASQLKRIQAEAKELKKHLKESK